jgi:hypothetical protein
MEKVSAEQYSFTYPEFTHELRKDNATYRKKLDDIRLGRSIYTVSRQVNTNRSRTHRHILNLTTTTAARDSSN